MKFLLPLLFCFCLLRASVHAQTTVSGRVLDAKSGDGLPGVTILQTGTLNGVSSDVEGNFKLAIVNYSDSVALTFSYIGYVTQRRNVAAGSTSITRLAIDTKTISCDLLMPPRAEVGLSSGIRYAPLGGTLTLYGRRLIGLPITTTVGYQTNFSRNHVVAVGLGLPALWQRNRLTISENLNYQFLQATPADIRFSSYTATISVGIYRIGKMRLPTVLLGGGYARRNSLAAENSAPIVGGGYLLGLASSQLPLNFIGSAQATYWPGYWQWQARLQHHLPGYLLAGVSFNGVGDSYSEVSLSVSHTF
ncbi:hypothetical protein GCM10028822_29160 [Hymenobacter terrigena]